METSDRFISIMDSDIQQLEETLSELKPQPLPVDLLARLDLAMNEQVADEIEEVAEAEEMCIADELSDLEPAPISPEMIARLDEAMSKWHESVPVEEKVIPLNQENAVQKKGHQWMGWKSAAAVGVLGASMAFLTANNADKSSKPSVSPGAGSSGYYVVNESMPLSRGNIVPASNTFQPREASTNFVRPAGNQLRWSTDGKLIQRFKVEVTERLKYGNDQGEFFILQQPRIENLDYEVTVD